MKNFDQTECNADGCCGSLRARLVPQGKGFVPLHTAKPGKPERFLGVAYKKHTTDRGLLLNWCPFCGGQPGYFEREAWQSSVPRKQA